MKGETSRIPIIKLWDVLLVPLQGEVSDVLAEQLCDEVLNKIASTATTGLAIDVTGLWLMDSHLCSVVARIASSAALMGTRTVVCGMSPEIAFTLESMGLEMRDARTALSLEEALQLLGVRPVARSGDGEWAAVEDEDPFQVG
jgi:rsbT antagonist protein RsbS